MAGISLWLEATGEEEPDEDVAEEYREDVHVGTPTMSVGRTKSIVAWHF